MDKLNIGITNKLQAYMDTVPSFDVTQLAIMAAENLSSRWMSTSSICLIFSLLSLVPQESTEKVYRSIELTANDTVVSLAINSFSSTIGPGICVS